MLESVPAFFFDSNVRHSVSQCFVSRGIRYPRVAEKKKTERGALEWLDPFHYSLSWSQGRFEIKSFHSKIVLTVENNSFHGDENDRTRFRAREKKRLRFANPNQSCRGIKPLRSFVTFQTRLIPPHVKQATVTGQSRFDCSQWSLWIFRERARKCDERAIYIIREEREKFPWARNVSWTCRKFIYRGEKTSLVMEL